MHRMTHGDTNKGLTIVELMITIAILGVLTALFIPFIGNPGKRRLNGAAKQVAWELMAVKMQAISHNNDVRITFAANNHEYTIWDDTNNDDVVDAGEAKTTDIRTNYHGVTFSATPTDSVTFEPKGTPANPITVNLAHAGLTRTVTVSVTGNVRIN